MRLKIEILIYSSGMSTTKKLARLLFKIKNY